VYSQKGTRDVASAGQWRRGAGASFGRNAMQSVSLCGPAHDRRDQNTRGGGGRKGARAGQAISPRLKPSETGALASA
jgi:hypothetical protein